MGKHRQGRGLNILLAGCQRFCPAKMRSVISKVGLRTFYFYNSSLVALQRHTVLLFSPAKWGTFKVGRASHSL